LVKKVEVLGVFLSFLPGGASIGQKTRNDFWDFSEWVSGFGQLLGVFWGFLGFFGVFWGFLGFFGGFLGFFGVFGVFLGFLGVFGGFRGRGGGVQGRGVYLMIYPIPGGGNSHVQDHFGGGKPGQSLMSLEAPSPRAGGLGGFRETIRGIQEMVNRGRKVGTVLWES